MSGTSKINRPRRIDKTANKSQGVIYSYTAGLFDGEGYLGIIKHHNRKSISYSCTAELTNTNKQIIEWLVSQHGGVINEVKRRTIYHPNEKPKWKWILRRRTGLRTFLRYIEYYSIIKYEHIKLARALMSKRIDAETAFERMKVLNHRGKENVSQV